MTPWKPSLVLALLLLSSDPATALQVLESREGETLLARISRREVTRITWEHERIRRVTGNAGEYVLERDEEHGQVFIRPASPEATRPINVFVTGEHGTVALLLQPVDTPSDTLVIRGPRGAPLPPSRLEQAGRHVRTAKNLLLAMATDALPEDMEVREPGTRLTFRPGAPMTLQRSWLGSTLVAERFQLTNTGARALPLTERDFHKAGVFAVAVEATQLKSGESTSVFVIRERRSDD